jgi:hypothetical protein
VTVSPHRTNLVNRCKENLEQGKRPWVLVPKDQLAKTEGMLRDFRGRIAVSTIESFVGQNLEEIAEFRSEKVLNVVERLISEHNRRIDKAEGGRNFLKLLLKGEEISLGESQSDDRHSSSDAAQRDHG